jgi:hypothetical protein
MDGVLTKLNSILTVLLIIFSVGLIVLDYPFHSTLPVSVQIQTGGEAGNFRFLDETQLTLAGTGLLTFSVPPWVFSKDKSGFTSSAIEVGLDDANNFKAQYAEDHYAIENFFRNHVSGGLILESGALDGKMFSTSWAFEKVLGWRAIHIEANPHTYSDLVKNRPEALNINAALCREPQTVHLIYHEEKKAVGGMWEFMSPEFKKLF